MTAKRAQNLTKLWAVAQVHREFTAHDISSAGGRTPEYVRLAFNDWLKAGYIEEAGSRGDKKVFRVVERGGVPPMYDADGNQISLGRDPEERMWFSIRKSHAAFSPTDVWMWSNSDAIEVTRRDASAYCQLLLQAGYLRCERKARSDGRPAMYRLIRDAGPRAPRARRVRAVWDPNSDQFTLLRGRVPA
ncbi:hypothetical protein [Antarcticimicrobium sediminis]|uniref:Uncharacterized protein n=1 Tax=Antarcticimicrobium sediminis TaxID=2546227 RepID=A0A4R5F0L8_9RHOB|nr:hypothetical protein [Antarcticimicrobium sediminis]TDE40954.1 hypothetical protein E1B25_01710 [Antarcticimicrobium sediminis]